MAPCNDDALDQRVASLCVETRTELRAETLLALSTRAGSRLWPIIEASLESEALEERLAAIVAAERTRCFQLEERLMRELTSPNARLAAAAAHAISTLGDLRTQVLLEQMLGVDELRPKPEEVTGCQDAGVT